MLMLIAIKLLVMKMIVLEMKTFFPKYSRNGIHR